VALGDDWPLVIAGPWLRRVDTAQVSVFLAFTGAVDVTVTVTLAGTTVAISTATPTVAIGEHLHVVVATAKPNGTPLSAGNVYEYDVSFSGDGGDSDLEQENLRAAASGVVDVDGGLPSFSLPPVAITDVNLVHGSCRKAHGGNIKSQGGMATTQGGSIDMLASLDKLIEDDRTDAVKRPHQLFLTGDQIYADDVADALLAMLTPAGDVLLEWDEELPGLTAPKNHPADLAPGTRADVMTSTDGTGAGVTADKEVARSHLIGFGEFCAMYLFSFSPALWPETLPAFKDVFPDEFAAWNAAQQKVDQWKNDPDQSSSPPYVPYIKEKEDYEKQAASVANFQAQLVKVRRALANIPTYTICDDHEVTDDWYMNQEWCKRVLGQPLGRRLVRNALLAYGVFQAWGNTPEQFTDGGPGETLLDHLTAASANGGFSDTADSAVQLLLNIPSVSAAGVVDVPPEGMTHGPGTMTWHYRVAVDGAPYEVLVFDTRTWRSFATSAKDPPELIGETGFGQQMSDFGTLPDPTTIEVTIAVVPGPVFDLPYMTELKRGGGWGPHSIVHLFKDNFALDYESWDGQPVAQQRLLSNLFARSTRLVALAGDVHFSFAARMTLWATKLFENEAAGDREGALAQFTCSPLCNEDRGLTGPYGFTTGGFDRAVTDHGTVPAPIDVLGWNTPPSTSVVTVGTQKVTILFWEQYRPWMLVGTPALLSVNPPLPPDADVSLPSDFRYHVDYLEIDGGIPARGDLLATKVVSTDSDSAGLRNAQALLTAGGGLQVVGANSLGRIRFTTTGGALSAIQELLWRPDDTLAEADAYSRWTVSLEADPNPGRLP
jgi:hypothetical protein